MCKVPDWQMGVIKLHAVFADGRAAKPPAYAFTDFLAAELAKTALARCVGPPSLRACGKARVLRIALV